MSSGLLLLCLMIDSSNPDALTGFGQNCECLCSFKASECFSKNVTRAVKLFGTAFFVDEGLVMWKRCN